MTIRHAVLSAAALSFLALPIVLSQPALAGPCTTEIHDLQVEVNAKLDAIASNGKGAVQSTGAMLHRQPTPDSLAAAEAKVGDISEADVARMRKFMAAAKEADEKGDAANCHKALADARSAMKM